MGGALAMEVSNLTKANPALEGVDLLEQCAEDHTKSKTGYECQVFGLS